MKKVIVLALISVFAIGVLTAQKHITRTGNITFFSTTPIEDIEGINNQATSLLDTESGALVFSALMKGFQFEKSLMQEHFNEKYVESEKYPKAQFKGTITNLDAVDFTKDGTYTVNVAGPLTMHGESKDVSTEGTITVAEGKISANAEFSVSPEDFKIKIPKLITEKIAESLLVTVQVNYEPFDK